jgi:hypothetical protein
MPGPFDRSRRCSPAAPLKGTTLSIDQIVSIVLLFPYSAT